MTCPCATFCFWLDHFKQDFGLGPSVPIDNLYWAPVIMLMSRFFMNDIVTMYISLLVYRFKLSGSIYSLQSSSRFLLVGERDRVACYDWDSLKDGDNEQAPRLCIELPGSKMEMVLGAIVSLFLNCF